MTTESTPADSAGTPLVQFVYDKLASISEPIAAAEDFCSAIVGFLAIDVSEDNEPLGDVIHRMGREIQDRIAVIGNVQFEIMRAIKPRPGLPVGGEVDEAEGDVELIALGERLKTAYAAEREAFARDCSAEEGDVFHKACSAIVREIEKTPATTLAGLRVKAAAIDWCCGSKPFADDDDTTDKRLVTSLLTDLEAMHSMDGDAAGAAL